MNRTGSPGERYAKGYVGIISNVAGYIFLAVCFYLIVTPIAVITRLAGRDKLRLRQKKMSSYWIQRNPPGPKSTSYNTQF